MIYVLFFNIQLYSTRLHTTHISNIDHSIHVLLTTTKKQMVEPMRAHNNYKMLCTSRTRILIMTRAFMVFMFRAQQKKSRIKKNHIEFLKKNTTIYLTNKKKH